MSEANEGRLVARMLAQLAAEVVCALKQLSSLRRSSLGFLAADHALRSAPCRFPASRCEQPGQSDEVVGGHREDEAGPHPLDAAIDGQCHAADGLCSAGDLFDPFAVFLGQGVTFVARIAPVDGEMPIRSTRST